MSIARTVQVRGLGFGDTTLFELFSDTHLTVEDDGRLDTDWHPGTPETEEQCEALDMLELRAVMLGTEERLEYLDGEEISLDALGPHRLMYVDRIAELSISDAECEERRFDDMIDASISDL